MNDQSQMNLNRNYGVWSSLLPPQPQPQPLPDDPMKFKNNNYPPRQGFVVGHGAQNPRSWKGKIWNKGMGMVPTGSNTVSIGSGIGGGGRGIGGGGGYKPPTLHELQSQNRRKARQFFTPKKDWKKNERFAPYAPRNTSSFIIRAKKSGGITSLVSPCPVTPAVLPTPMFSPSREVLVDMAKEEWGVDGYGSMNGLIRLRSPGQNEDEEDEDGGGSSESDVEEHVEVERRLDHDLSRFEMIYPNFADEHGNHMDDQEMHIAHLEEENLTLKERLFLMEREMVDLRMRLVRLENESPAKKENNSNNNDKVLENEGGNNEEIQDNDETIGIEQDGNKDENNESLENESTGEMDGHNVDDEASENEVCHDHVSSEKSACDGDRAELCNLSK